MKTHLFSPNTEITMCGIHIKSFSTTNPMAIDCKRCMAAYSVNASWYWLKLGPTVPIGALYSNRDTPLPGLHFMSRRRRPSYL